MKSSIKEVIVKNKLKNIKCNKDRRKPPMWQKNIENMHRFE